MTPRSMQAPAIEVHLMATSRTGTAKWIAVRDKRRRLDFDAGVVKCPECGTWLDWEHSRRPNSAEPDHIVPHSKGGQDVLENTRTICRRCNQSLGGKAGNPKGSIVPRRTAVGWLDGAGDW